ncbi:MAG: hypothetical protein P8M20_05450 [Planctomycetaceae bacterium]|nr:hypothetical protein [Planctomycetaceae bacterium]
MKAYLPDGLRKVPQLLDNAGSLKRLQEFQCGQAILADNFKHGDVETSRTSTNHPSEEKERSMGYSNLTSTGYPALTISALVRSPVSGSRRKSKTAQPRNDDAAAGLPSLLDLSAVEPPWCSFCTTFNVSVF